jgi:hypothetical protein
MLYSYHVETYCQLSTEAFRLFLLHQSYINAILTSSGVRRPDQLGFSTARFTKMESNLPGQQTHATRVKGYKNINIQDPDVEQWCRTVFGRRLP